MSVPDRFTWTRARILQRGRVVWSAEGRDRQSVEANARAALCTIHNDKYGPATLEIVAPNGVTR